MDIDVKFFNEHSFLFVLSSLKSLFSLLLEIEEWRERKINAREKH